MGRDRVPDATARRAMRTAVVLLAGLLSTACSGSDPVDLGVDLPELRIPDSDRLAREPWVAHVAVLDDGVKVELEYEPADGGPRERMLADGEELPEPAELAGRKNSGDGERLEEAFCHRVATVLHASPDESLHATLRRLPIDHGFEIPRLYLAVSNGPPLPVLVLPPFAEIELNRLGMARMPQDIVRGLSPGSALDLRITRSGESVRYRWQPCSIQTRRFDWSGGDVTLGNADLGAAGKGSILPQLTRSLATRHPIGGHSVAVVLVQVGEGVRVGDFVRAVECAGGDADVCFFPYPEPWGWTENLAFHYSIRVPRAGRQLDPVTWFLGEARDHNRPFRLNLQQDGGTGLGSWPAPAHDVVERLTRYAARKGRTARRVDLQWDGRTAWSLARPWAIRVSATGIDLALRFQFGERWLDEESELRLPGKPEGERLPMTVAEAATRATEARGRVVVLSAPDDATVEDVWQAALLLMDAGAAGIAFE